MATSRSSDGNSIPSHDLPPDPLLEPISFILPGKKRAKKVLVRPSWLPQGWDVVLKFCKRGASLRSYQVYYPPYGTDACRSRKEVENYINIEIMRKASKASVDEPAHEESDHEEPTHEETDDEETDDEETDDEEPDIFNRNRILRKLASNKSNDKQEPGTSMLHPIII